MSNLHLFGMPVQESNIVKDSEGFIDVGSSFSASFSDGQQTVCFSVTETERECHLLTIWWDFWMSASEAFPIPLSYMGYIIIDTENFSPEPSSYQEWCVDWLTSEIHRVGDAEIYEFSEGLSNKPAGCPLREWEICEILRPE